MLSKLNGQDQRARWTNRITEFGIRDIMIVEELYGNRKLALVIIDAQRKFCNDRPDWKVACEDMVRRINRLIYAFRKAGAPIISVQYEGNTFCRPYEGTDGDEYFRGLAIRPDDITVVKRNMNGFNETDLKKILDAVNVDKILLVGTVTQYCVMSTYFSCFDNHIIPYLGEKATVTTDDSIRDAAEVVCKTLAEGFVFDTLGVPRLGDEVPVFTEAAVPLWDPSRLCDIAALANSGGGHFVVGDDDIYNAIKYYESVLEKKIMLKERDFFASASFGYAEYPSDTDNTDTLFSYADMAMYEIKRANSSAHILRFTPDLLADGEHSIEIERKIRTALEEDTIYFDLQPQFDMDHKLRGFEALARMKDSEGTIIPPGEFIPIAETVGLIDKIDARVFRNSTKFFGELIKETGLEAIISVNVSVRHLIKEDFVNEVRTILKKNGVPPSQLELEITESIIKDQWS